MRTDQLLRTIDWFVPVALRADTGSFWQARIFAISHLLSPCFAAPILIFLYQADPHRGIPFWTLFALGCSFCLLPFGMRLAQQLRVAAMLSVCSLAFLSVLGSFFYGGVSSPFLPWFLTALLLGFFYLGDSPRLVLGVFAANLIGLALAREMHGSFPDLVPLAALSGVGVISVCAATLYTSMMALYYANVVTTQSKLQREAERHLVTAANMAETMRQAKERAERANEAKSVFLAKMNHQLRTPLNAVIGYSEILLEDAIEIGDDAQTADLERINSAGRHLLSLVTDVLDVNKIASENIELVARPFDLAKFTEDVASTCRSLLKTNDNAFHVRQGENLGVVVTDETKLRQVVINLLGNAAKFTSQGTVTLTVRRDLRESGDTVTISVSDTGIGMSPAQVEKLFTDFNQADASTAAKYGGTGLGLALSRNLCHVMLGEITVASSLGAGSTFTLTIPADARSTDAARRTPTAVPAQRLESVGA